MENSVDGVGCVPGKGDFVAEKGEFTEGKIKTGVVAKTNIAKRLWKKYKS